MHFTSLVALVAFPLAAQAACSGSASGHRRHHAKLTASNGVVVSRTSDSASSSAPATSSAAAANLARQSGGLASSVVFSSSSSSQAWSASSSTAVAAASSTASSSSSSTSGSWGLSGLFKNNIAIGWLPDDASGSGGTTQTLDQINNVVGAKAAHVGFYAQAQSGKTFTGDQFTYREASILGASVFIATIMPTGGWQGLTSSDNSQAVNIANVVKTWSDKGVEVWVRFGHEMNYYQTDGTYQGSASDFLAGWKEVAKAVKSIAPKAKMFWSPNVASMDNYASYYPGADTVDIVGVDFYPKSVSSSTFLDTMQAFHDKYTNDNTIFAIGETGLGMSASYSDRLAWAEQITSSAVAAAMPQYKAMAWFNYYKDYDFRIAVCDGDSAAKGYFVG